MNSEDKTLSSINEEGVERPNIIQVERLHNRAINILEEERHRRIAAEQREQESKEQQERKQKFQEYKEAYNNEIETNAIYDSIPQGVINFSDEQYPYFVSICYRAFIEILYDDEELNNKIRQYYNIDNDEKYQEKKHQIFANIFKLVHEHMRMADYVDMKRLQDDLKTTYNDLKTIIEQQIETIRKSSNISHDDLLTLQNDVNEFTQINNVRFNKSSYYNDKHKYYIFLYDDKTLNWQYWREYLEDIKQKIITMIENNKLEVSKKLITDGDIYEWLKKTDIEIIQKQFKEVVKFHSESEFDYWKMKIKHLKLFNDILTKGLTQDEEKKKINNDKRLKGLEDNVLNKDIAERLFFISYMDREYKIIIDLMHYKPCKKTDIVKKKVDNIKKVNKNKKKQAKKTINLAEEYRNRWKFLNNKHQFRDFCKDIKKI